VTGSAFAPSTTLTVTIASTPTTLGTVTVSSTGTFTQSFSVPCNVAAGDHTVSATASSGQSTSAQVTLTDCPLIVTAKFTG
jgi:hexosaminidase